MEKDATMSYFMVSTWSDSKIKKHAKIETILVLITMMVDIFHCRDELHK